MRCLSRRLSAFAAFFFCLTSKSDELGKASNCVAVNLARHTNCVWLCKMKNTVVENTSKRSHSEMFPKRNRNFETFSSKNWFVENRDSRHLTVFLLQNLEMCINKLVYNLQVSLSLASREITRV